MSPQGIRAPEVRRLRGLIRDPHERRMAGRVVLEGARLLHGARDRDARIESVFVDAECSHAEPDAIVLEPGVVERVSDTRSPQGVIAIAVDPVVGVESVPTAGAVLIAVDVNDPGNAGTIIRSAEAFGLAAVVFAGNSVDPRNPKAIRSSAGALFGVVVSEERDPMHVVDTLRGAGRRLIGAVATGGPFPEDVELAGDVGLVVGSEAHGLAPDLLDALDGRVSIPMQSPAESLNVAMAATALCAEAARQRRVAS